MKFYYLGCILSGVMLIFKTLDDEYVKSLNLLFNGSSFYMKSVTLFIAYFILMALSWVTVVKEVSSYIKKLRRK